MTVAQRITQHPMWFLGGALAAGYALGGGLGSRLGMRLLRVGGVAAWRFMVLPALEQKIRNQIHSRMGDGED
jgi:hypothetical protein